MIVLQSVSKSFDGVFALHEVSFSVSPGDAVALVGPSGSGKTTILRLIAGFEVPDAGSIALNGRSVSQKGWVSPPHERNIGMVFQKPALWPHLTVEQNVLFGLGGLPKAEADKRLRETLKLVSLDGFERRYPSQLSGGEAQRVALARAVAPTPQILLMDEPLVGFDAELNSRMIELIHAVREQTGTTLLYVSHDIDEAQAITERVVALRHGRVEYQGLWDSGAPKGSQDE